MKRTWMPVTVGIINLAVGGLALYLALKLLLLQANFGISVLYLALSLL